MSAALAPTPFQPGFREVDGSDLNKAFASPIVGSQDGITATAGGTQAAAYQLTAASSNVATVANAADSVRLPPSAPGEIVTVCNSGANSVQVFGYGTETINGVATATGIAQPAGAVFVYSCTTLGKWIQNAQTGGSFTGSFDGVVGGNAPAAGTFTTATVTTGNITSVNATTVTATGQIIESVSNALTAVGTNRGTSLALTKGVNNVTTALSGTGVTLPAGVVGMIITVFNGGANPIQVYGAGSDTIDTVAGATGVVLTNAKRAQYFCVAANTWISAQLSVISA